MKIKKELNHKTIWLDSVVGMTWGFLATLVVGTIIGLFGINQNNTFSHMIDHIKNIMIYITPFGIGVGIGIKEKLKPIQIITVAIAAGLIGHSKLVPTYDVDAETVNWSGSIGYDVIGYDVIKELNKVVRAAPGDVFAAWIGSTILTYFFKVFQWYTMIDVIIVPMVGVLLGVALSLSITYITTMVTIGVEFVIDKTANQSHLGGILLAPVIGALMGLALSMPISSAAIALAVKLHGDAATAAIAGTAAQMISFGLMTYMATKKIGVSLAVGFGSSMLQMPNFIKKPKLLIIPIIVSALTALIAVSSLPLPFELIDNKGSVTSGMGTCALYGQIFTLNDNGWDNWQAWLNVILMQLLLPLLITYPMFLVAIKKQWILPMDLKLEVSHG